MITRDSIDSAFSSHQQWKRRLSDAIANGRSEYHAEIISRDHSCAFGQWLHTLPGEDIKSEDYAKVKALHAEFHKTTGEVLRLALGGRKEEALRMMEYNGEFGVANGKLVIALQTWKEKL
jgi:hypothetical protein